MPSRLQTAARRVLSIFFILAGANHFLNPGFYVAIMPPYLPWHLELVHLSGVAEILLGAMVLFRRTQVPGGWGLIGLCLAVFPANVHMALHPELFTQFSATGLWWRLPLQVVAIAWIWWSTLSVHARGRARYKPYSFKARS